MEINAINNDIPLSKIKDDLQRYADIAISLGATHAQSISTQDIIPDYRVRFKCMVPKCRFYNTNANCPPYAPSIEDTSRFISSFSFALLAGIQVPSEVVTSDEGEDKQINAKKRLSARRDLFNVISKLESEAFYDGYYFATGFSSGSCKGTLCPDIPCQALENGKGCRFPLKSRPSMEAVGMDVFKTATNTGWPVYPIGGRCQAKSVPHGMFIGIVLVV